MDLPRLRMVRCRVRLADRLALREELVTIDELLAAVAAEIRAIGPGEDLAGLDACRNGFERAAVIYNASTSIRLDDRKLFLRFAGAFTAHAIRCLAEGTAADAEAWAERAEAELDRYREPAPDLHPYVVAAGGAS